VLPNELAQTAALSCRFGYLPLGRHTKVKQIAVVGFRQKVITAV
jgi:hypothetical protein